MNRFWCCVRCALLLILPLALLPVSPATAASTEAAASGVVFGYVVPSQGSEAIEQMGPYMQERLSLPVEMRGFANETQLYKMLARFREVDVAFFSQAFLERTPPGELFRVAQIRDHATVLPYGELVAQQGVDSSRRQKIRAALAEMDQTSAGREILEQLEITRFVEPARWLTPEWENESGQKSETVAGDKSKQEPSLTAQSALPAASFPVPRAVAPVTPAKTAGRPMPAVIADMENKVFRVAGAPVGTPEVSEEPVLEDVAEEVSTPVSPEESAVVAASVEPPPAEIPSIEPLAIESPPVTSSPVEPLLAPAVESVIPETPAPSEQPVELVEQKVSSTSTESLPVPVPVVAEKAEEGPAIAPHFVVPEEHGLTKLFSKKTIPVLTSVDDLFVNTLADNQVIGGEFAHHEEEATLSESIRAGRRYNRESRAALARTEQASAQTKQAFALLLPNASMRLTKGREISKPSVVTDEVTGDLVSSSTHTRTDAAVIVRQPLVDLPSFRDWRRRGVLEEARGENYRVSDGDAYISTVSSYLDLVASRLQTEVTRDFEAQLVELFNYIEKRTNAGASSVSDMARVDARREATQSFRLEQESAHTTAWFDFVRLTNIVPQTVRLPELEEVGASSLPQTLDRAVVQALQTNPEISLLNAELQAAKIDQTVATGRYFPKLSAEYSYNYSEHAGGQVDPEDQRDQRFMAVLDWELFSGGRDYNFHKDRTARHKELLYRLDDQRRRVVQELSANYSALATTRQRIASGYQELESISTAAEAMSKRMLSGNQSLLDLLDVYDRLFRARSRLITLHALEMNTLAQLVRLTQGTPWAVDAEALRQ